ncbi:hypothetical protein NM688_g9457 [Phlebia brevispora]|uniref:Uncharacterized protein n=1 Tax=Phlebia brevispora TaxID=194682 RepID=A0ACC1RHE6_9APHY|nr:hypothetical protein NM688_g9457 [Phlebia brevispora]
MLLIDSPTAIRLLLERVPPALKEAARFRSRVWTGPDVLLPDRFAIHLSASLRYMFYKRPDEQIVTSAWHDFKDRLRWNVHFEQERLAFPDVPDIDYDPDYRVIKPRKEFSGRTPAYIEAGLKAGDNYVDNYVKNVVPALKTQSKGLGLVWIDSLKSYLEENEYLVSATDKNLGVCVISKKWFIENTTKLWNDPLNYRKLSPAERQMLLERKERQVKEAAQAAEDLGKLQLAEFLLSKIPDDEHAESNVPVFYGIPKVHKTPVKMRPIVPCHSNAQSPAASFVSKQLKPLVEACPYVLKGSKDLARRLNELELSMYRKPWIVSGDIVAYYPNIPLAKCLSIVANRCKTAFADTMTAEERHLFFLCYFLANKGLIIDFNGESSEQIRGLAMGIACSPDLANLYGAHFEEKVFEDPLMNYHIPFYGRYLDDVLAIVYAPDRASALALAHKIKFDDVEIEWNVSEWNTPFLDMFVYLDPQDGQVHHKPYSKPLNHKERIPWASHHPKD